MLAFRHLQGRLVLILINVDRAPSVASTRPSNISNWSAVSALVSAIRNLAPTQETLAKGAN